MKLISFYTKNTIYEKEVEDLLSSCRALEIDHYVEERDDLGSWERNCAQKPIFILECINKFNEPVLWVDSDAILLQKPSLQLHQYDLALYFNNPTHARSATIFFNATREARKFLTLWHKELLKKNSKVDTQDQPVMNELIQEKKIPNLKIGELPLEYMHIFDRDSIPLEKTVILHFQASRTAKMDPIFWKNLKGSDLKAMRMKASKGHHTLFDGF